MANPQKGEIDIEVDNHTYRLALDLNALCEFQELMYPGDKDFDMAQIVGKIPGNFVLARALFWATLRRHHNEMTFKDVSNLITAYGYKPMLELLPKLLEFMNPDEADRGVLKAAPDAERPRNAQVDGTGARSMSRRARSA